MSNHTYTHIPASTHDAEIYQCPPRTWKDKLSIVLFGFAVTGIVMEIAVIGFVWVGMR